MALLQAKMPEPQLDATPRFGPAAKAARAKEREQEQAKLKAQQKVDVTARRWDIGINPLILCSSWHLVSTSHLCLNRIWMQELVGMSLIHDVLMSSHLHACAIG